jgi:hypothetical protein
MSTSLRTKKFRPRKFDNTPRFNYGRGQAYGQNYGRGREYRQNFGRGQDNRQNGYRVNPQKENSQTDKKSENVGRGRGRARPLRSGYISFDTIDTVAPVSTNNLHLT